MRGDTDSINRGKRFGDVAAAAAAGNRLLVKIYIHSQELKLEL